MPISWIDQRFYPQQVEYWDDDLDPRVLGDPHLDGAVISDGKRLPFPDRSFDLEHLEQPAQVFAEISMLYERVVNSTAALTWLRILLVIELRKRA